MDEAVEVEEATSAAVNLQTPLQLGVGVEEMAQKVDKKLSLSMKQR
jgi:hypothetical protein